MGSDSIGEGPKTLGVEVPTPKPHVFNSSRPYSRSFASIRGSNCPSLDQLHRVTENESNRLLFKVLVRRIATAEHIGHQVHDLVLSQQPQ